MTLTVPMQGRYFDVTADISYEKQTESCPESIEVEISKVVHDGEDITDMVMTNALGILDDLTDATAEEYYNDFIIGDQGKYYGR